MSLSFRRVLVANRGEIAVRLVRACREAGVQSVAIYSAADAGAPHTRLADEAHEVGPAPASASYLSIERILDVARRAGADAVHPGYGFLSEDADFAEACLASGLVWIGPPPAAMRLVGDKSAARGIAAASGVPIVPGYDGADQDAATFARHAERIGFPLLVKAAAGGGGRGMRVVESPDALSDALGSARDESTASFGNGALLLEKLIAPARHVEVQILADAHGQIVHLGERDCSVQRRHQKVIEESPSPAVTAALRAELGDAAIRIAARAGYVNAGTCEFLLAADGSYSFIEMNARLQVEHPVTELVTGVDLVKLQLRIAAGLPLPFRQVDVALRGHAIECRLYAEDPARDFLPSIGTLTRFAPPLGAGLRHDVGVAVGSVVTPHYDAMLGKLIVYGADRDAAIARARAALDEYRIEGVATNLPLLRWILDHPDVRAGRATIDLLAREWRPSPPTSVPPEVVAAGAAVFAAGPPRVAEADPWRALGPWRIARQGIPLSIVTETGPTDAGYSEPGTQAALVSYLGPDDTWQVVLDGGTYAMHIDAGTAAVTSQEADGPPQELRIAWRGAAVVVTGGEADVVLSLAGPPTLDAGPRAMETAATGGDLRAPMPGRIVRVAVAAGDRVAHAQVLVVLESMKIEQRVVAPRDGVVAAVLCRVGETVEGGARLVQFAHDDGTDGSA